MCNHSQRYLSERHVTEFVVLLFETQLFSEDTPINHINHYTMHLTTYTRFLAPLFLHYLKMIFGQLDTDVSKTRIFQGEFGREISGIVLSSLSYTNPLQCVRRWVYNFVLFLLVISSCYVKVCKGRSELVKCNLPF